MLSPSFQFLALLIVPFALVALIPGRWPPLGIAAAIVAFCSYRFLAIGHSASIHGEEGWGEIEQGIVMIVGLSAAVGLLVRLAVHAFDATETDRRKH